MGDEVFVPFVEESPVRFFGARRVVLVFDDHPLVETAALVIGHRVHLADADGVVPGGLKILNPGVSPTALVVIDVQAVRVERVEQAGS